MNKHGDDSQSILSTEATKIAKFLWLLFLIILVFMIIFIKPLLYNLYNLMFLSLIGKLLPQIAESFVQSVKNIKSDLDLTTYL